MNSSSFLRVAASKRSISLGPVCADLHQDLFQEMVRKSQVMSVAVGGGTGRIGDHVVEDQFRADQAQEGRRHPRPTRAQRSSPQVSPAKAYVKPPPSAPASLGLLSGFRRTVVRNQSELLSAFVEMRRLSFGEIGCVIGAQAFLGFGLGQQSDDAGQCLPSTLVMRSGRRLGVKCGRIAATVTPLPSENVTSVLAADPPSPIRAWSFSGERLAPSLRVDPMGERLQSNQDRPVVEVQLLVRKNFRTARRLAAQTTD